MTGQRRRVLVVDDDPDHLVLTSRALRGRDDRFDLEIDTVSSGGEALDYLHRRDAYEDQPRPHLILLDLKMPGMGGLEVLQRLKSDADLRRIPVIVLSSSDRNEDIEGAYDLGGNSYVVKQVSVRGIREGLREVASYWFERSRVPSPPP